MILPSSSKNSKTLLIIVILTLLTQLMTTNQQKYLFSYLLKTLSHIKLSNSQSLYYFFVKLNTQHYVRQVKRLFNLMNCYLNWGSTRSLPQLSYIIIIKAFLLLSIIQNFIITQSISTYIIINYTSRKSKSYLLLNMFLQSKWQLMALPSHCLHLCFSCLSEC